MSKENKISEEEEEEKPLIQKMTNNYSNVPVEKLSSIRQLEIKDINLTDTKNEKKIPLLELKESTKTNNIIKEKEKENYDKKEYQIESS